MKFSLVIPCYNEAANLPLLIQRCQDVFTSLETEVVLVDNGSTDDSAEVMAHLLADVENIRFVRVMPNEGYGHGILSGLRAASGDILAWTHADMQTDPYDALEGFNFFQETSTPENIFVKGLRYGRPLGDCFFSFGMSIFETLLMRVGMRDINAQPTMFHKTFFAEFDNPPKDFSLDLYAYARAKQSGLKVKRFPVLFGERAHGSSHWNINSSEKIKFIKRTWKYSLELRRKLITERKP